MEHLHHHIQHSFKKFGGLPRRAIIPLLAHPNYGPVKLDDGELPDLGNVQGDIVYLFPKGAENFIFFRIKDLKAFKEALKKFKPTSSEDVQDILLQISDAKADAMLKKLTFIPTLNIAQYQIAFSRMGLNALGVREPTGDVHFDKFCMMDDKDKYGPFVWDDMFIKPNPDPVNGSVNDDTGALHGVITIAAKEKDDCAKATANVLKLFGSSITVAGGEPIEGRARKGSFKGHEHFGFMDGISQPALRGVVAPRPGQIQVDPGVILMGYKGDPIERPTWTKDGTIMVWSKLEQDVIKFEKFTERNGTRWREFVPGGTVEPPLSDQEGTDLFGARLIGRWKSGAPLARCPFRDDPNMAEDQDENNNFDYAVRGVPGVSPDRPSDYYCPFTAHTRKTAPRQLDPIINQKFLEGTSIVRGGLPYGDDVTSEERDNYDETNPSPSPRGLLFNCYMTSLDGGFFTQTVTFAANDYFPPTSFTPQKHGTDPILNPPAAPPKPAELKVPHQFQNGEEANLVLVNSDPNSDETVSIAGFAQVTKTGYQPPGADLPPNLVSMRGGEYFFVPSISALRAWAGVEGRPGGVGWGINK